VTISSAAVDTARLPATTTTTTTTVYSDDDDDSDDDDGGGGGGGGGGRSTAASLSASFVGGSSSSSSQSSSSSSSLRREAALSKPPPGRRPSLAMACTRRLVCACRCTDGSVRLLVRDDYIRARRRTATRRAHRASAHWLSRTRNRSEFNHGGHMLGLVRAAPGSVVVSAAAWECRRRAHEKRDSSRLSW
jgi:hypothetical protein